MFEVPIKTIMTFLFLTLERSKSKEHPKFSCYDQPGNYLPTSDRIRNPLPTRILNKFFDQ